MSVVCLKQEFFCPFMIFWRSGQRRGNANLFSKPAGQAAGARVVQFCARRNYILPLNTILYLSKILISRNYKHNSLLYLTSGCQPHSLIGDHRKHNEIK